MNRARMGGHGSLAAALGAPAADLSAEPGRYDDGRHATAPAGFVRGPQFPQPVTVMPPHGGLPVADPRQLRPWAPQPPWWWLGCHGGAGVTTLTLVISGGVDAGRRWPFPQEGQTARVVLVARTHVFGLEMAQKAATQWASASIPDGIRLLGLVLIRDADGPLPKPLAEYAELIPGAVPRTWNLPWVREFRVGEAARGLVPPRYRQLARELSAMVAGVQHA